MCCGAGYICTAPAGGLRRAVRSFKPPKRGEKKTSWRLLGPTAWNPRRAARCCCCCGGGGVAPAASRRRLMPAPSQAQRRPSTPGRRCGSQRPPAPAPGLGGRQRRALGFHAVAGGVRAARAAARRGLGCGAVRLACYPASGRPTARPAGPWRHGRRACGARRPAARTIRRCAEHDARQTSSDSIASQGHNLRRWPASRAIRRCKANLPRFYSFSGLQFAPAARVSRYPTLRRSTMQGIRDYIASQGPRVTMCAGGHGRLVPSDVAPIHRRRVADADRCPARGLCAHARRAEARLAVIRNRRADSDPWPAPPPAGRRQQGRPPNVLIRVSLPGASLEVVAQPVAAIATQACCRGGGGGGRAADAAA